MTKTLLEDFSDLMDQKFKRELAPIHDGMAQLQGILHGLLFVIKRVERSQEDLVISVNASLAKFEQRLTKVEERLVDVEFAINLHRDQVAQ